jgi:hypothetical protein
MKKYLLALLFLVAATAGSAAGAGQAISQNGGSIEGTVTDPTGAAIPGATVVITSPDQGYTHTLTTDKSGVYSLGPLLPGPYTISITATGFGGLRTTTIVRLGTVTNGNEKLTVGNSSETVEVTAGALQVNTDQIGVSGTVTQEQIDTLPVNGRNILDIAQIEPGVILQSGMSFDPTKAGYTAISVDGVGGRTTRILLDGQDITDETVGTTLFNVPSGAIQEFQLNRSTQDVSGEVTSTGQVLIATRSGTNKFHGNVFGNFQDNHAGFANLNGSSTPFERNQFGGYVGGPIIKDKLFFFGGAERIHQQESDPAIGSQSFAALLAAYPLVPAPFKDTYSTARLDYNAPHGIRLFVRGTYSVNFAAANFGFSPYSIYGNRDNVPAIVGGADMQTGRFTHSFRVGYEKFHNILGDDTQSLGNSIYNPSTSAANQITLYGSIFAGPNYLAPQQTYQSDKQFRYDGTWLRGAHNFKFGFESNRILNGGFAEFFGASLFSSFSNANPVAGTACAGTVCGANNPVNYEASYYLIGNGNSLFSERPGFGLTGGGDPSWRFAAYAADTWKVSSSLTLTAGLRWSVDTDRANQDLPTPLCGSSDYTIPGCTGSQPLFDFYGSTTGAGTLGYKTHQPYANFGPQVGFVFSPGSHKTAIRGGGGIYYENDIFNNTGNARTESIQSPGAFQNDGFLGNGSPSVYLPGLGSVSYFNPTSGVPCATFAAGCVSVATVSSQAIGVAGPQLNALKAYYQSQVAGKATANPDYIGGGDGLYADNIYAGPYVSPYSIQLNGGVQQELAKGLLLSVDYIHNATLKVPLSVDVNHVGAARTLNTAAAQHAIALTTGSFGCAGGYTAAAINCAIGKGAQITDFAGNGLDSPNAYYGGGYAASAEGLTVGTGAAFPGDNPNVGAGLFILPVGKSGYDAMQVVLQQQKAHPLPGIVSTNFQISYSLSRIVTATGGGNPDQFFAGARPWDNDSPTSVIGRSGLDHTNELSFGGSLGIKYGLQVGFIGHFFSAPPSNLTLDTLTGSQAQIFQTDLDGDGQIGDLVPGTGPGYYMHQIKGGASLNKLINSYNTTHAGQPTPAGQAVVAAGLFTQAQLVALNGVQQPIATAPSTPLPNSATRTFDLSASYPIKLSKFREGLSIVPGVSMYNVFNMSNFGGFGSTLLNAGDAGTDGFINGPTNDPVTGVSNLYANRITRGSGTFDQGGPRSTEFQLKVNF